MDVWRTPSTRQSVALDVLDCRRQLLVFRRTRHCVLGVLHLDVRFDADLVLVRVTEPVVGTVVVVQRGDDDHGVARQGLRRLADSLTVGLHPDERAGTVVLHSTGEHLGSRSRVLVRQEDHRLAHQPGTEREGTHAGTSDRCLRW